jgi:hypothetical protein
MPHGEEPALAPGERRRAFLDACALSAKGDPLEAIDRLVSWESFRADIEAVVLTPG